MELLRDFGDLLARALGWAVGRDLLPPDHFSVLDWLKTPHALVILGLLSLEYVAPFKKHKADKQTLLFGVYFLLAFKIAFFLVVIAPAIQGVWAALSLPSLNLDQHLPAYLFVPIGLLGTTLAGYWSHRWLHQVPILWHIHKIHHAPKHLNWATRYQQHFGMQILHAPLSTIVTLILGHSLVPPFGVLMIVADFFEHTNVRIKLGWLNYIISTPEVHRYHHSSDPRHQNCNFSASIVFWDHVFGTFMYDPKNPATEFGLNEPTPEGFVDQQIEPLKDIARDVRKWWRSRGTGPAVAEAGPPTDG